jgi:uncharacterized membrane protein YedE/YeeE
VIGPDGPDEIRDLPFARQKSNALVSFFCGALFAVGLGLAGMTSPAKVLAFLDVTSPSWDPSLAFVMAGAIGVHFVFARRAVAASRAGGKPVSASRFHLPDQSKIDRSLLVGAALFGIGWGIAGYCPGPAVVAFMVTPIAVIFVGAMLAGMFGTRVVRERLETRAENRATALAMEREIEEALKREREGGKKKTKTAASSS